MNLVSSAVLIDNVWLLTLNNPSLTWLRAVQVPGTVVVNLRK
jgi:hypothetical protein